MSYAREIWRQMLTKLEIEISAVFYEVWIETLEPVNLLDGKLILMAPTEQSQRLVNEKYKDKIQKALCDVNPMMGEVIVISPEQREQYSTGQIPGSAPEEPPAPKAEVMAINPKYNFESFVVGKSNQFMHAAARAVADEPGTRYNPLFIYGGTGLGKTHIMHAIGNSIKISHPHLKVLYVSIETLVNDFIYSIRASKEKGTSFREKYRSVDVLMIDDIQLIKGKPAMQEEMFHTFNDLHQANKQLVMTSDRTPKEIPDLEERLRSRFEWGLITDVQPPDLETRIAILQKKAQAERYNIPLDVLSFMAERMDSNVRDMESLLNKVIFLSRLYEKQPTLDIVKEALKDYNINDEEITADDIIDAACAYFNVSRDDLVGKKKTKEVVEPRQLCIYLMTEMLALPLAAIGNLFGGRDHTTVMHARDKIAEKLTSNPKVKVSLNDIKDMVYKK